MDTIHREFQHGGELHKALHGSAPFRQPDQWKTVRGRAWAIHDGILQVIDKKWDDLKMIKQVGRHAGANTFPGGEYQELPMSPRYQITRAAELESLSMFRQFISDCCNRHQVPDETVFDLKLAVDEACTNVIEHGHKGMDPGSIILSFRIEPDRILVSITDFGHIFEPGEAPRPDVEAALDDRPLGGLGLYLIYQTMDNIDYQSSEEGNTLTFTKYIKREINS